MFMLGVLAVSYSACGETFLWSIFIVEEYSYTTEASMPTWAFYYEYLFVAVCIAHTMTELDLRNAFARRQ